MGTIEKPPTKRQYERVCISHGTQLAEYTAHDDGRVVEMRCSEPGCTFRQSFEVHWPDAVPRRADTLGP